MAEEKNEEKKEEQTKAVQAEKTYTQKDLFLYCGITGVLTGLLGYFIGENRGEKKAKEKYEFAINEWQKKTRKQDRKKNDTESQDSEEEFRL